MGDTHSELAAALAVRANEALEEVIEKTGSPRSAFSTGDQGTAELARWSKVRALQAQAQVHATLAVADELARAKDGQ